jgi:hypothetical protein
VRAAWDGPSDQAQLTQSPLDPGYRGPKLRGGEWGLLEAALRGFADRFLTSFPEAVMLVFFLLFVGFSIVWALQIL